MEKEIIYDIIAQELGVSVTKIRDDKSFARDFGADLLDVYKVITKIEETFMVLIPDEYINSIRTVGDITEFLKKD